MTDWTTAPVFGDPVGDGSATIRPSAYGIISGHDERVAVVCDAVIVDFIGDQIEADHVLEWMSPAEAIASLAPLSHRWAMAEWTRGRTL